MDEFHQLFEIQVRMLEHGLHDPLLLVRETCLSLFEERPVDASAGYRWFVVLLLLVLLVVGVVTQRLLVGSGLAVEIWRTLTAVELVHHCQLLLLLLLLVV